MPSPVSFTYEDRVSKIVMDDGKANIMSLGFLDALHETFDKAEAKEGLVLFSSGGKHFSGGFDLNVLNNGSLEEKRAMLISGAELALRILSFPHPVIPAACVRCPFRSGW